MDALEAIFNRRSIRKYTDKPVPRETIDQLLAAAMAAPSAGNEQPWRFVIIDDRSILDDVPSYHPHSLMVRRAPAAVLVCADMTLRKYDSDWWIQDCAAATENLLLAATRLGLGAVWLGVYPMEDRVAGFRKALNIPDQITPFALIPLGWPDETKSSVDRYQADRVVHNGW